MEVGGKGISYDIIFEILSRLPVQSLLRFRSVCKTWNSLISNYSHFIKSQFQRSREWNYPHKLMMVCSPHKFRSIDYETSDHGWKEFEFHSPLKNRIVEFLCSYYGLILFRVKPRDFFSKPRPKRTKNTFILWNPAIRKYKLFSGRYYYGNSLAFGICSDLLVVILRVSSVLVYDVKHESSYVVNHRYYYYDDILSERGVIVNGMLHWFSATDESSFVIIYYDLLEAKLKELPLPAGYDDDGQGDCFDLAVWSGQLCVYDNYTKANEAKIWVMKEYGKKESWTCLMVIPFTRPSTFLNILTFTAKGEVILKIYHMGVVIYNPSEGTFKTLCTLDYMHGWSLTTYVESLVLLDSW